jgi:hypothetical protein
MEQDHIQKERSILDLLMAKENVSQELQNHIRSLDGVANRYKNQALDLGTKYQSLVVEMLEKTKREMLESQIHINKINEVETVSINITVPLARLLPNSKIIQSNSGYVCIPLLPLGEEGYEINIYVEFAKDNGFLVHHDVDGLKLEGWSDTGRVFMTIEEAAQGCLFLLTTLPEPALVFLRFHNAQ